ncbi:uncharacterized protein Dwil_GK19351 [Drosophila willistoni]|uniref:Small ribosomal subunit protein eS28 n=1 Tax=Drosophila willistoni TaxID=7260 RepID=B4N1F9_DROWI|nr:40S ribosomal protein S28 [Drosophila willistoni]EDW78070.2 uncharacterized protein Dwil_GK19351 [Drosophila willistoni]
MFKKLSKMRTPTTKARVIKVLSRIGASGRLTECRLQLLEPPRHQIMRAVKGPVRTGQIIEIDELETFNP